MHRTQSIALLSNQHAPGVVPWFDGVTFVGEPEVPLTESDLASARWTACEKAIAFLNAEQMKYTPPDVEHREERTAPLPPAKVPIVGATPEETAALEETAKRLADANREVMEGGSG